MLVSTKGRYALRVMIDLAEHREDGLIPLKDIALRQNVSEKYLGSIIVILSKAGLVRGVRGKNGGYELIKEPAAYSAGSIISLTDGSLAPVSCLEEEENFCINKEHCRTLPMWMELDAVIQNYLEQVTLEDLVRGNIKSSI